VASAHNIIRDWESDGPHRASFDEGHHRECDRGAVLFAIHFRKCSGERVYVPPLARASSSIGQGGSRMEVKLWKMTFPKEAGANWSQLQPL